MKGAVLLRTSPWLTRLGLEASHWSPRLDLARGSFCGRPKGRLARPGLGVVDYLWGRKGRCEREREKESVPSPVT